MALDANSASKDSKSGRVKSRTTKATHRIATSHRRYKCGEISVMSLCEHREGLLLLSFLKYRTLLSNVSQYVVKLQRILSVPPELTKLEGAAGASMENVQPTSELENSLWFTRLLTD